MTMPSVAPSGIDSMAKRARALQSARKFETDFAVRSYEATVAVTKKRQTVQHHKRPVRKRTPPVMAAVHADPSKDAIIQLISNARLMLVAPALMAKSADEFHQIVESQLVEFIETMDALAVLRRTASHPRPAAGETDYEFMEKYYTKLHALAGEAAGDELRFAVGTYERAGRLARRITESGALESGADGPLAEEYRLQGSLHSLGVVALMDACMGLQYSTVGLEQALELARGGALRAYSAARRAVALRTAPSAVQMGTGDEFDREDAYLAGIGT